MRFRFAWLFLGSVTTTGLEDELPPIIMAKSANQKAPDLKRFSGAAPIIRYEIGPYSCNNYRFSRPVTLTIIIEQNEGQSDLWSPYSCQGKEDSG
jgi:hypothetical protein